MPETYGPYGFSSLNEFIRDDKWKLIHEVTFLDPKKDPALKNAQETFELYDLKNDPGEAVNSAAAHPETVKALTQKLKQWVEKSRVFIKDTPSVRDIPDEVLEKAKQHGYW
jgi:arylsulfatase A-like enzyme